MIEYGGFSGIVTIEDLIEEVMGNIEDEYDKEDLSIKKIDNDTYMIDGMITLNDFNDYFNVKIESDDYDTLNGISDRLTWTHSNECGRKKYRI